MNYLTILSGKYCVITWCYLLDWESVNFELSVTVSQILQLITDEV